MNKVDLLCSIDEIVMGVNEGLNILRSEDQDLYAVYDKLIMILGKLCVIVDMVLNDKS